MSDPDPGDTLLMMSLCKFYQDPANMNRVIPIIDGQSDISLRLIDYFVTSYVRRQHVTIPTPNGQLNVHLSYRAQLQAYSKQAFDCFRRRQRILFCYATDKSIETTIGQLNFFRWLLSNSVLDYILGHRVDIERDMVQSQKASHLLDSEQSEDVDALMKQFPGTTVTFV